jgi:CheY-like chemotaxis protein
MSKHILLVDDDALLRRSLAFNLQQAGFSTITAANAEDALVMARQDPPDLVILDIGLPGMDGLDALRHFQESMSVPIIFLTARRRELDQVLGLQLGADDYVTKPFDVDVLLARIKTVLRRSQGSSTASTKLLPLVVGDLMIDPAAHKITLGDKPMDLPMNSISFTPWHWKPDTLSPQMTCWLACGEQSTTASLRLCTFTFAGCARNWKRILIIPPASLLCVVWVTSWSHRCRDA